MLHRLAERISSYYIDKRQLYNSEKEIYTYCFEVLLSTSINLIITIIMMLITRLYIETICFTISFMLLRGAAGGYHSKTHIGCFTWLIIIYSGMYLIYQFANEILFVYLNISFAVVGSCFILIFAPVDNINKRFELKEKRKFRKKSLIVLICLLMTFIPLCIFDMTRRYSFAISYVMLTVSIFLIVGKLINQVNRRKDTIRIVDEKETE